MSAVTKPGCPERGDDNVGAAGVLFKVACGRMADGDGAVAGVVFLHEQLCNRLAYDVAASEHHAFGAFGGYAVTSEKLNDAGGCGGQEAKGSPIDMRPTLTG